jgi:hypothetical protein
VTRAYRILRRLVRKALKRPRLWLNAWQYKQSEDEAEFFASQRQILVEAERRERRRQVKLQMQRNAIQGW